MAKPFFLTTKQRACVIVACKQVTRRTSSSYTDSTVSTANVEDHQKGHPFHPLTRLVLVKRLLVVALGFIFLFQIERHAYHTDQRGLDSANNLLEQTRNSGVAVSDIMQTQSPPPTEAVDHFAACLVLQNEHENQYLTEWIAYHYQVLPLRRLIVWHDPLSVTKPHTIIDKWKDRINITLWDEELQIYPVSHPYHKELLLKTKIQRHKKDKPGITTAKNSQHHSIHQARDQRQNIFFGACLRQLKNEGRHSWTTLSHTDEYTLLNPRLRNISDPLYRSVLQQSNVKRIRIPLQQTSGSVLRWLQQQDQISTKKDRPPCIPLTSKQFGTKDQPYNEMDNTTLVKIYGQESYVNVFFQGIRAPTIPNPSATALPQTVADNNDNSNSNKPPTRMDFLTLRWLYWGHPNHHQKPPLVRKSLLDLSQIPKSVLKWKVEPHNPLPNNEKLCPSMRLHESQSPLIVHHYAGTTEHLHYDHHSTASSSSNGGAAIDTWNKAFLTKINANDKPLEHMERMHSDTLHVAFEEGNRVSQWLDGFVDKLGVEEAKALLDGVGHVH